LTNSLFLFATIFKPEARSREMAKASKGSAVDFSDHAVALPWFKASSRRVAEVIAARTALRAFPALAYELGFQKRGRADQDPVDLTLPVFRALSIIWATARYPSEDLKPSVAADFAADAPHPATLSSGTAFSAVRVARDYQEYSGHVVDTLDGAARAVSTIVNNSSNYKRFSTNIFDVAADDVRILELGIKPKSLAEHPLWPGGSPRWFLGAWQRMRHSLLLAHKDWEVWVHWYEARINGGPANQSLEIARATIPQQVWEQGAENVNRCIKRLIAERKSDPQPIEDILGPIAIIRRPDGRIGIDPGLLAFPALPPSIGPEDHVRTLSSCKRNARKLRVMAAAPTFQGRGDYADALTDYIKYLPDDPVTGNILLADTEARVLNKLFTAEQDILPIGFATRLTTLLEDNIALRAFYPEVNRHYDAAITGRLSSPLARDAIDGIQRTIHDHTPTIFDESVGAVMGDSGKPIPEVKPPRPEDSPARDPNRPRPPKDPVADVDPAKMRSLTFATTANGIWSVLKQGKDLPTAIEGWQKAYNQCGRISARFLIGSKARFLAMDRRRCLP
jgi:hypothetical protein